MSEEIQLTLNFRHDDPPTSEAAFNVIAPGIRKNHLKFLAALQDAGSSTASEMMDYTGKIYNTTWRRLSELKLAGMIVNTSAHRKNSRGFGEVVFVLTPAGESYLRTHISELDPE